MALKMCHNLMIKKIQYVFILNSRQGSTKRKKAVGAENEIPLITF